VLAGFMDRESHALLASSAGGETPFLLEVGEDRSVDLAYQSRNSSDLFRIVQKIPTALPETLSL